MYESVCYREPFLKEVIVRIDFSSAVEALATTLPLKVSNAALARFPLSEPRKAIAQELQLSAKAVKRKTQEFTEWNYYGRDREKRLVISPPLIFATYSRYASYEELKDDFLSVVSLLFAELPDLRASRLGLRYINHIEMPVDPLRWDEYIDKRLLGLFQRFTDPQHVSRLFNIAEFNFDGLQIKFQFGAPNPDFPAPIRRPLFVLDIDGYLQGLQELQDLSANIDHAHERIQNFFEEAITERLREQMNAKRD
jgi:uncharacterized protein (TIGR04255 family)